jgi:hypothetical protein
LPLPGRNEILGLALHVLYLSNQQQQFDFVVLFILFKNDKG